MSTSRTARHAKIAELEEHGKHPVLGYLVISDITTGNGVPFPTVDALITRHGLLDTSLMESTPEGQRMQRPTPDIIMERALEQARVSILHDRFARVSRVPPEGGLTIYVLKERKHNRDDQDVDFGTIFKIVHDAAAARRGDDPWSFPAGNEVVLRPLIDHYSTHAMAWDASRAVIQPTLDRCHHIKLRARSGTYFVHESFAETLQQLRLFLVDWGVACGDPAYLTMLPLLDAEIARFDMQRMIMDQLRGELADRRRKLNELKRNVKVIRQSTIANELAETKRLRDEAAFYADLLDTEAAALNAEIDRMRRDFEELVAASVGASSAAG